MLDQCIILLLFAHFYCQLGEQHLIYVMIFTSSEYVIPGLLLILFFYHIVAVYSSNDCPSQVNTKTMIFEEWSDYIVLRIPDSWKCLCNCALSSTCFRRSVKVVGVWFETDILNGIITGKITLSCFQADYLVYNFCCQRSFTTEIRTKRRNHAQRSLSFRERRFFGISYHFNCSADHLPEWTNSFCLLIISSQTNIKKKMLSIER